LHYSVEGGICLGFNFLTATASGLRSDLLFSKACHSYPAAYKESFARKGSSNLITLERGAQLLVEFSNSDCMELVISCKLSGGSLLELESIYFTGSWRSSSTTRNHWNSHVLKHKFMLMLVAKTWRRLESHFYWCVDWLTFRTMETMSRFLEMSSLL